MNKLLLTTSAFLIVLGVNAQKDRSKKIESKYISLPSYDISTTDPTTVGVEFAMNSASYGTEKLKDAQSTCVPKGGSVKDAIKVTSYYYEIPYSRPESYLVARSTDGTIVYAEKTSNTEPANLKFGWDTKMSQPKCEYFRSDKLKKDFASKGKSFMSSEHSNYEKKIYGDALESAKAKVYLSYVNQDFEVYSAKGKIYNYEELDATLESVMSAYESIKKNGLNDADIETLKAGITVWKKELETVDLEDKKARITEEIAKGLHENCARAYFYMFDYDAAKSHAKSFLKLYGNFSNNRSNAVKELVYKIELQSLAAEKNAAIIEDVAALNKLASASDKTVNAQKLSSDNFDRLASDYLSFGMSAATEVREVRKEEEAEAIASGELNPYQKFVSDVAVGGPALLMTMAPSPLSGFPELKELPKEMCEFTELTQLVILNNKIESISPEISNLKSLKKLDLSGNNLKTLPAEIGDLESLQTLKLSKNPLESIPAEIANCKNLSSVVIKGTKLSDADIQKLADILPPKCKIKN